MYVYLLTVTYHGIKFICLFEDIPTLYKLWEVCSEDNKRFIYHVEEIPIVDEMLYTRDGNVLLERLKVH